MNGQLVVKRYALALFETADKLDLMESTDKDIKIISEIVLIPEIRNYCFKSDKNQKNKREFVDTAFIPYISELTGRLLSLLVKNGRREALPFLGSAFKEIKEERDNLIRVTLETAVSATDNLSNIINEKMTRRLDKKIILKKNINPSIIGGFRILWQNRIIDLSVNGKIKKLKVLLQ
ncbi:MAG: ATP synthase F1 subunit delta [Spirochaetales bacterium]|nr:ATP synthase F1 subunit delta [Spirochaetales bacterium]